MSQATVATVDGETARRRGWGWLLLVPGMLYLGVFFVFPTIQLFFTSLYDPTGSFEQGYEMTWHFGNYVDAVQDNWNLFVRSFAVRRHRDRHLPDARLPTGLCDRLQVGALEARHAGARHRPVLHQLPAADAVVAHDPRRRGAGHAASCSSSRSCPTTAACWPHPWP